MVFLRDIGAEPVDGPVAGKRELVGGDETVVLVVDEQSVRDLARSVLEEFSYTVILAENGDEAVRIFEENRERVDVLMFDVIMPKKTARKHTT